MRKAIIFAALLTFASVFADTSLNPEHEPENNKNDDQKAVENKPAITHNIQPAEHAKRSDHNGPPGHVAETDQTDNLKNSPTTGTEEHKSTTAPPSRRKKYHRRRFHSRKGRKWQHGGHQQHANRRHHKAGSDAEQGKSRHSHKGRARRVHKRV